MEPTPRTLLIQFGGLRDGDRVLDIDRGIGSLISTLPETANLATVTGINLAEAYLDFARSHNSDPRIISSQPMPASYRSRTTASTGPSCIAKNLPCGASAVRLRARIDAGAPSGGHFFSIRFEIDLAPNQPVSRVSANSCCFLSQTLDALAGQRLRSPRFAHRRFERLTIPTAEVRCGPIGALKKCHERRFFYGFSRPLFCSFAFAAAPRQ